MTSPYPPAILDSLSPSNGRLTIGVAMREVTSDDEMLSFFVAVPANTPGGPIRPGASHIVNGRMCLRFGLDECHPDVRSMAPNQPHWASLRFVNGLVALTIGMTEQKPPVGAPDAPGSSIGIPLTDVARFFRPGFTAITITPLQLIAMRDYCASQGL